LPHHLHLDARRPGVWAALALLVVTSMIVVLAPAPNLAAAAGDARTVATAKADLEAAEKKLDRLAAQKAQAERSAVELAAERKQIDRDVGRLDAAAEDFHLQLRQARRDARLATVEAYVSGNRDSAAVDIERSTDALWQQAILSDRADAGVEAAIRYQELRSRAEDAVVSLADDADRIDARIRQAATDADRAGRSMTTVRRQIASFRQEIEVLKIIAQFGGSRRGNPGPAAWAALRSCESHGNYAINSGNGFYGAYQFDLQTWQSLGGAGLPSSAPPWEQDARAAALYQTRGSQPWPICGRFLG
jgi:hypothetical protein